LPTRVAYFSLLTSDLRFLKELLIVLTATRWRYPRIDCQSSAIVISFRCAKLLSRDVRYAAVDKAVHKLFIMVRNSLDAIQNF